MPQLQQHAAAPRAIGVLGGTFDPIHLAHLVAANQALTQCQLDEVVFVPTAQPQLKPGPPVASAAQRVAMTRLAIQNNPCFTVSTVDVDRGGATYTVETLEDLQSAAQAAGTPARWFFIVGADAFAKIASWYRVETLARLAHFIVLNRGSSSRTLPTAAECPVAYTPITIPSLEISSSHCRQLVRDGNSIQYLVPDKVWQYIENHGLYRASSSAAHSLQKRHPHDGNDTFGSVGDSGSASSIR